MEGAINMTNLISAISDLFTAAMGWVGDVLDTVAGQPILLLMCVAVPLVGLGISFTRRLFSVG